MRRNVYSSSLFAGADLFALKFYLDGFVLHQPFLASENERHCAIRRWRPHTYPSAFPRFDTISECDGRTDRRTDRFAVAYTARCENCQAQQAQESKGRKSFSGVQERSKPRYRGSRSWSSLQTLFRDFYCKNDKKKLENFTQLTPLQFLTTLFHSGTKRHFVAPSCKCCKDIRTPLRSLAPPPLYQSYWLSSSKTLEMVWKLIDNEPLYKSQRNSTHVVSSLVCPIWMRFGQDWQLVSHNDIEVSAESELFNTSVNLTSVCFWWLSFCIIIFKKSQMAIVYTELLMDCNY